jgi:YHS domain-containing protein
MTSLLFRFLFFILILWLMRRVLGSLLGLRKRTESGKNAAMPTNSMVKDPVCGMYIDSRLAIRIESRKEEFYFCSEECKSRYLEKSAARG